MRAVDSIPFAVVLLSGCASSMKTYDAERNLTLGVPFRASVLVDVERVTTFKQVSGDASMARYCTDETAVTLEVLPIGKEYFVSFEAAALGKAEFSLELTDAGALKKLTMGSDPGTSAAIEAVTGLASAVLPYALAEKGLADATEALAAADSTVTAKKLKDKHCAKARTTIGDVRPRVIK